MVGGKSLGVGSQISFRIRASSFDLLDYTPQEFQELLRGWKANFMRTHHLVYHGLHYISNWGTHELTVTRETSPNLGVGYVHKTPVFTKASNLRECSYNWVDKHPTRVVRQSVVMLRTRTFSSLEVWGRVVQVEFDVFSVRCTDTSDYRMFFPSNNRIA